MLCGSDALVYDPGPETERIVTEVAENARHSWERMGLAPVREGSLTITQSIEEATDEVTLIQESVPEDVIKKQVLNRSKIGAGISVDRFVHLRVCCPLSFRKR